MFPSFAADLAERVKKAGPIIIGLVGAGQMGTDLIVQIALMQGVRIGAIAVRAQRKNAVDAALLAGHGQPTLSRHRVHPPWTVSSSWGSSLYALISTY